MPIEKVKKETKAKEQNTETLDATIEAANTIALDAAERQLAQMYETPQPKVCRMAFSLDVTIPTGNYENLRPKIEVEYIVPEDATPPNEVEQLDILREQIALFIYPLVQAQTAAINVKQGAMIPDVNKSKLDMAASYNTASPLFHWLTTFDRPLAGRLLTERRAFYQDQSKQ